MQKAKIITIILGIALFTATITGCFHSGTSQEENEQSPPPGTVQLPPGTETEGEVALVDPEVEERLMDVTWISPGKVIVSNLYEGARAEYPELPAIRIHNGGEAVATFMVSIRVPDYTESGYEALPEEYYTWITISDPTPLIPAKGTVDVVMEIVVTDEAPVGKCYEIWISIIDLSQTGEVRTELCSRWFLNMR